MTNPSVFDPITVGISAEREINTENRRFILGICSVYLTSSFHFSLWMPASPWTINKIPFFAIELFIFLVYDVVTNDYDEVLQIHFVILLTFLPPFVFPLNYQPLTPISSINFFSPII